MSICTGAGCDCNKYFLKQKLERERLKEIEEKLKEERIKATEKAVRDPGWIPRKQKRKIIRAIT